MTFGEMYASEGGMGPHVVAAAVREPQQKNSQGVDMKSESGSQKLLLRRLIRGNLGFLTTSAIALGACGAGPAFAQDAAAKADEPAKQGEELGFDGRLSNLFGSGNKTETAQFKGEPTRESLTEPPPGYQTPSPNFAYGTGPKESLNKEYNPAAGKYGE